MRLVALYPHFDHPAIEERYASWQTQLLLRSEGSVEIHRYDPAEAAADAVGDVEGDHVLVITDPLLLPSPSLAARLHEVLVTEHTFAAVPVTNVTANPQQRVEIEPYYTLRELQELTAARQKEPRRVETVTWDASDPAAFYCTTAELDRITQPLQNALNARKVSISHNDFVHRWTPFRGQSREDLLTRIPLDVKSVLDFGCGEGFLGEAIKKRQKCRVVGVELDPKAVAGARKRIDDVYSGDVREIVELIHEQFDLIIGGDILEHLDEPWTFLASLRRISKPGGQLLLSIPNLANASVVGDLLAGRFDYVYAGLTCAGHLRFFTKRTIEDMLTIAGWDVDSITPHDTAPTAAGQKLIDALGPSGRATDDLLPMGYYVIARNRA